ncbi:hypothetical protein C8R44DRAFT_754056 [Mycena epipterygia]|nr:hypothetical protein C8R44DRAFT_754056 [Mycena epipterygia]
MYKFCVPYSSRATFPAKLRIDGVEAQRPPEGGVEDGERAEVAGVGVKVAVSTEVVAGVRIAPGLEGLEVVHEGGPPHDRAYRVPSSRVGGAGLGEEDVADVEGVGKGMEALVAGKVAAALRGSVEGADGVGEFLHALAHGMGEALAKSDSPREDGDVEGGDVEGSGPGGGDGRLNEEPFEDLGVLTPDKHADGREEAVGFPPRFAPAYLLDGDLGVGLDELDFGVWTRNLHERLEVVRLNIGVILEELRPQAEAGEEAPFVWCRLSGLDLFVRHILRANVHSNDGELPPGVGGLDGGIVAEVDVVRRVVCQGRVVGVPVVKRRDLCMERGSPLSIGSSSSCGGGGSPLRVGVEDGDRDGEGEGDGVVPESEGCGLRMDEELGGEGAEKGGDCEDEGGCWNKGVTAGQVLKNSRSSMGDSSSSSYLYSTSIVVSSRVLHWAGDGRSLWTSSRVCVSVWERLGALRGGVDGEAVGAGRVSSCRGGSLRRGEVDGRGGGTQEGEG